MQNYTQKKYTIHKQSIELWIPDQKESSIQKSWEKHQNQDRFFPFWIAAWNGVFALNYWLRNNLKDSTSTILEVGCGGGVLAQLIRDLPQKIYHTDLVPDAVSATHQLIRHSPNRECFTLDLSQNPLKIRLDCIIAAEIFYEDIIVQYFCSFLEQSLSQNGVAWVAEPFRYARKHNEELIRKIWPGTLSTTTFSLEINQTNTEFKIYEFRLPI